jgi:hypothetical protein
MLNTAAAINARYDEAAGYMRPVVHVSARSQKQVLQDYPKLGQDYGYVFPPVCIDILQYHQAV